MSRVPILMYHQVAPPSATGVKPSLLVTPRAFAAQMRLLHALGHRTLRLAEMVGLLEAGTALPRRRFVLTFDDGFVGVLRYAAPLLTRLGFTATVFVPTRLTGTCQALDGGPDSPQKALMSWDELRTIRTMGCEIGAHTRTHPHLTRLSPEQIEAEIAGSRDDLAAALGEAPALFAYPYGEWSAPVAEAVRRAGFVAACATQFGRAAIDSPRYGLPRISISADLDLPRFAYRLALADRIAARRAAVAADPAGAPR
jgi:peptidoglycan/xylan/chitin deacetylase (PgdA/CDA1 family)